MHRFALFQDVTNLQALPGSLAENLQLLKTTLENPSPIDSTPKSQTDPHPTSYSSDPSSINHSCKSESTSPNPTGLEVMSYTMQHAKNLGNTANHPRIFRPAISAPDGSADSRIVLAPQGVNELD